MPAGLLALRKPGGPTSAALVGRVRRLTGAARAGHSGTLDPAADGVLIVALGQSTSLFPYLPSDKTYRAVIRLGATTATDDAQGEILTTASVPPFSREQVAATLERWVGPQLQIPPMVSARRHRGERLYQIARRGETVLRAPRRVLVHALRLLDWQPPDVSLEAHCSSGTYIRSLAADLGRVWGCGAHLLHLTRTRCNGFGWEEAVAWETFEAAAADGSSAWRRFLVDPNRALAHLPGVEVNEAGRQDVSHGRPLAGLQAPPGLVRVLDAEGRLLAVARAEAGRVVMERVFVSSRQ